MTAIKDTIFTISFHCHYENGEQTKHYQDLKLKDIPKWIEAYKFTHPNCIAVSFKIWFADMNN